MLRTATLELRARLGSGGDPAPACSDGAVAVSATGVTAPAATFRSVTPGLSICALRSALSRAVAEEATPIVAVALLWLGDHRDCCGLCRQTLIELAPDLPLFQLTGSDLVPLDGAAALPEPFRSFRPAGGKR